MYAFEPTEAKTKRVDLIVIFKSYQQPCPLFLPPQVGMTITGIEAIVASTFLTLNIAKTGKYFPFMPEIGSSPN